MRKTIAKIAGVILALSVILQGSAVLANDDLMVSGKGKIDTGIVDTGNLPTKGDDVIQKANDGILSKADLDRLNDYVKSRVFIRWPVPPNPGPWSKILQETLRGQIVLDQSIIDATANVFEKVK